MNTGDAEPEIRHLVRHGDLPYQKISDTQGGFARVDRRQTVSQLATAALGDLDGDGVGDVAVRGGATNSVSDGIWILFLNADGTVKAQREISNLEPFGSISNLGDIDGDGVTDIATGSVAADGQTGSVSILFLNADGSAKAQHWIDKDVMASSVDVLDPFDHFGVEVASLGDFDSDGVEDMIVGARGDDDGGEGRGAVWILLLNANGTLKDGDAFGTSLTSLGDLTGPASGDLGECPADLGSGSGDLLVNSLGDDDGGPNYGALWVLFLDGEYCSDGVENGSEECDDGNLDDGDGCDHACRDE